MCRWLQHRLASFLSSLFYSLTYYIHLTYTFFDETSKSTQEPFFPRITGRMTLCQASPAPPSSLGSIEAILVSPFLPQATRILSNMHMQRLVSLFHVPNGRKTEDDPRIETLHLCRIADPVSSTDLVNEIQGIRWINDVISYFQARHKSL